MENKTILLNCLLLLSDSLTPSFKESYGICIPTSIDLSSNGSFEISLSENNLAENDKINISVDDSFTLSDSHGKADISGSISNKTITFTSEDAGAKTINYSVNNASAGDWHGNLNIDISVETIGNQNIFLDGPSIQKKLNRIRPTKITFSHDVIEGTYAYDLSLDSDESILLYRNGSEVTITNMKNEKFKANANMSNFFKGLTRLTAIENIDYIDMSTCTDMNNMFFSDYALESLDLSNFDVSKVSDMSNLFSSCNNLSSVGDISDWDVRNVTNFSGMFYCTYKINNYGDLGKWNVSNKCQNISNMFAFTSYTSGTSNSSFFPSTLNLNNWDVSNIVDSSGAFRNAFNLEEIDISSWNLESINNMDYMFAMEDTANASKLRNIIGIDNLNVSGASKIDIFKNCDNLSKPAWYQ